MHVILTHENADFDAVAAQWAAHRLDPVAVPLLPRRVNRNVSQFLTLYWGAFNFQRAEDWRRTRIERVLLVDTQSLPNVRGLRGSERVDVIDHHAAQPPRANWHVQLAAVGATTTILVEQLDAHGLTLSADEASLFLLGIYEDTGSLTYDTTTPRDVRAAAWLLEHGASLAVVRRFIDVALTPAQQALYDQLLAAAEWHTVEGQTLVVMAVRGPDEFDEEISSVVSRLRDALLPTALFVLVALPHRIHLIARSASDDVDVGLIAGEFGGGGHSRAAAATVHGESLAAALRHLHALLPRAVRPMRRVAEIMSYHVKTLVDTLSIDEAALEMQRHGHEGYPVVDHNDRLVGLLSRRAVDRAVSHQLGRLPIAQIMRAGRVTVKPSDSIVHLQSVMSEQGWGQIPVVAEEDDDRIIGVVTRTDVLQELMQIERRPADPDMRSRLREALSPAVWLLVRSVSALAAELRLPIYFVGGLVRDVLLARQTVDIDIVVEGDAIQLVDTLVARFGGKIHTHARFGTAKWLPDAAAWQTLQAAHGGDLAGQDAADAIDFVSARTEFYEEPTVLPTVVRGAIKLDLLRRDFTINTLAVRLDGAHLGTLLDYYGGVRDLEQGMIRVLHSLSFIDDPTRILRAVRFEQRFGFTIEPRTLELLTNSIELLPRVTGGRIWNEMAQAFRERDPIAVMQRLDALGILRQLHADLDWPSATAAAFGNLAALLTDGSWAAAVADHDPAAAYLLVWLADRPTATQEALLERLRMPRSVRDSMAQLNRLRAGLVRLAADATAGRVERALRFYAAYPDALLAARALHDGTPAGRQLDAFWQRYRHVQIGVSGHDLLALGLKPGPQFATILDELLAARLDGHVTNDDEERRLLSRLVQSG